jgi:hypothetical protein
MPEDDDNQRPSGQEAQRTQLRPDATRRRRRESFLADLDEAQRLLERVAPRRTRLARLRQQQLMRTFLH